MKKYNFINGEERLESQRRTGLDFNTQCILWGCFDKKTNTPLPHIVSEASDDDMKKELIRLEKNREDYEDSLYDDSIDFYICPNTGQMLDFEGDVIDERDQNELTNG